MKYLTLILGILFIAFFAYTSKNAIDSCQEYEQLDSYNDTPATVTYPLFPKSSKYWGYETDDIDYLNGQILLPDALHSDTLKVVDAALLNYCNRYYDYQCDGDILDVLKASTVRFEMKRVPKFTNGQILYPDYVHLDTLVVVDADYLNKCLDDDKLKTDGDIMEILNETTVPLKTTSTIIKQNTDERGLISVVILRMGKNWH